MPRLYNHSEEGMDENRAGDYVTAEDYYDREAELLDEIKNLEAKIEAAKEALS